ncbi:extracellular solute-binding protein [Paenibacillus koleovorans]|uniref:extracellular solute-binding protein n=1 Tax=Paenibacillus koleovorans TaxID=121608 RepID=UPI0013E325D4|nr:extracellular solute-binding protein [Paenibacillus koleovorans]
MIKKRTTFDDRLEFFGQDIRDKIKSGSIKPGDFLISEVDLARMYNISKNPVRRVLAELQQEGLIEKIPCIGNRVCERPAAPAQDVTLTMLVYEVCYEMSVYERAIHRFEQLHPGVTIRMEVVPNAVYKARIVECMETPSDAAADLIILSDHHFFELEESGRNSLLLDMSADEFPVLKELYPQLLPMYTTGGGSERGGGNGGGGRLKALPITFSPIVYCCNTGIIPEPEKLRLHNWDDLLEAARAYTIVDANGLKRQFGLASTLSFRRWLMFLLQNEGSFFGPDGAPDFANEANATALQFFADLVHSNLLTPEMQGGQHADHFLFKNNRVALILSSYYFMNDLRSLPIRWDVVPAMPGNKRSTTLLIGSAIAIPAANPNRAYAQAFAALLAGEVVQADLKTSACTLPAHRAVAEDRRITNPELHPEHYHAFIDFMPQVASMMELGLDHGRLSRVARELTYLWSHMETGEEACRRIQEQILGDLNV